MRHKKATKRKRHPATGDAYVVGGHKEDNWNPDCLGLSMPFVPLAALMFLLGDVFDGHRQHDDPALVPLLRPHAGGGLDPLPLCVVRVVVRVCKAVWGRAEWAIVLLLPTAHALDADASPVSEVVTLDKVPHDPHVAATSLREDGVGEQGMPVVYQPHRSMTMWGAEYTRALPAIKSIGGCDVY